MIKKCPRCSEEKSVDDFALNSNKKDGLQTYCKVCKKLIDAVHYKGNKQKQAIRNRINYKKYKVIFDNIKSSIGCIVCKDNDFCCLDFHHCDSNKSGNVSHLIQDLGVKAALQEAKKCIVICASCHRKLHANRFVLSVEEVKLQQEKISCVCSSIGRASDSSARKHTS